MPEPVSLLWPPGFPAASRPASQPGQWCDDLGPDYLAPALDYDGRHADAMHASGVVGQFETSQPQPLRSVHKWICLWTLPT